MTVTGAGSNDNKEDENGEMLSVVVPIVVGIVMIVVILLITVYNYYVRKNKNTDRFEVGINSRSDRGCDTRRDDSDKIGDNDNVDCNYNDGDVMATNGTVSLSPVRFEKVRSMSSDGFAIPAHVMMSTNTGGGTVDVDDEMEGENGSNGNTIDINVNVVGVQNEKYESQTILTENFKSGKDEMLRQKNEFVNESEGGMNDGAVIGDTRNYL